MALRPAVSGRAVDGRLVGNACDVPEGSLDRDAGFQVGLIDLAMLDDDGRTFPSWIDSLSCSTTFSLSTLNASQSLLSVIGLWPLAKG